MFTGIIQRTMKVASVSDGTGFRRLVIAADWTDVKLGDSIAVNGVCLTASELNPGLIGFDIIKETLDKTNLGSLQAGDDVNIEQALRLSDRIDGHFVQGHVDGTGILTDIIKNETECRYVIRASMELAKFFAPKGSVCIDGVSLTIAAVRSNVFEVALIPTTLRLTTLGSRQVGWRFNVEADILNKTVVHYLEQLQIRTTV